MEPHTPNKNKYTPTLFILKEKTNKYERLNIKHFSSVTAAVD